MTVVHVAVAAIINDQQQVLVAKRQAHQHQGNLWEFPGGKVEVGEAVEAALVRESQEELGIEIRQPQRLIEVSHDYGDKSVLLDVWTVTDFVGEPQGVEGQIIRWHAIEQLQQLDFPVANQPIIEAIQAQQI